MALQHDSGAKTINRRSGYSLLPSQPENIGDGYPLTASSKGILRSCSHHWTKCADFVKDNAGLLLIALSQGFASLMGVCVKKLNELDPPVPPVEVS